MSDNVLIQMVIFNNLSIEIPFQSNLSGTNPLVFPSKNILCPWTWWFSIDFPTIFPFKSHPKCWFFPWKWWCFTEFPIEIPWKARAFSAKNHPGGFHRNAPRLVRVAHSILATAAAGPGLAHRKIPLVIVIKWQCVKTHGNPCSSHQNSW